MVHLYLFRCTLNGATLLVPIETKSNCSICTTPIYYHNQQFIGRPSIGRRRQQKFGKKLFPSRQRLIKAQTNRPVPWIPGHYIKFYNHRCKTRSRSQNMRSSIHNHNSVFNSTTPMTFRTRSSERKHSNFTIQKTM